MRMYVGFQVFDTIHDDEEVAKLRPVVGAQMQKIQESGKLQDGGMFADGRAGYFILDIDSGRELAELLDAPFADHCHIQSHPLMSFEELGEFFERMEG